ncbi:MAG: aldo/keto reductase [Eubacteriales bacterium]|nr:aldo/keto reductase [Eubacteriales bacterium]
MQYRKFGKIEFHTSVLGFGTMRLPCLSGTNTGDDVDVDESVRMIRYAIDNGVNYIDTAYPYHKGQSEITVGKALKDGYRQKVKLADKSPVFLIKKESDFDKMLETQLRRLEDAYIDLYLLHSLGDDTYENVVKKFDLIDKAERAKKAGKIGHIGFSFHDTFDVFEKILNGYNGWDFCQIQLNYLDIRKQAGLKGLKAAASKGLGVVIMEPLMGGKLAAPPDKVTDIFRQSEHERTPVQWALDFLWDMPEVSVVLSGMSTMEQTVQNIRYASQAQTGKFNDADKKIMAEVKKQFDAMISVPCTGCGYCMPCPQGVSIPNNLEAYNELSLYDDPAVAQNSYKQMLIWEGKESGAGSCIGCKICEDLCPQQIKISTIMPSVDKAFGSM